MRMGREECSQVVCDCDGADSWSSTSVWYTESFVKVEVAGIDPEFARSTDSNKGVEVCSVHIDLSPCIVNFFTDVTNRRLENTVS
jgi:hypothetical protein